MMPGFVLVEIIISVLIASFLSIGLLTTIVQINRVQQTINTITNVNGRIAILQNQMERDIMGAFVPAQIDTIQTSTLKQDQQKPLEKIFYGTNKGNGGRLDVLTFITSNPLEVFHGVKNIKLKPRVARVVYRLVPDERRKNSYILQRQEGTSDLVFEKYKTDSTGELRPFAMIDDIQDLTIKYVVIEQSSAEDTKQTKRTYKKSSAWQSEQKKAPTAAQEQKSQQKEPIRLPNYLEVTVSLWNSTFDATRTFNLVMPIAYKATEFEQPPPKEKEQGKEKDVQGGAPKTPQKAGT